MVMGQISDRELHEECGVFGVFGVKDAASLTYYGLHALQHRGQEGAGIVTVDRDATFRRIKGGGLVTEVFGEGNLSTLKGDMAIGHVRYTTAGGGGIENVQPFLFRHNTGDFALAHNGNIVNSALLRIYLENKGSLFQSTSDSEILAHLIKKETKYHDRPRIYSIIDALNMIEGAFAFLIMTANRIYACRDKYGLRPLSIGRLGDGYVVSSETCAFDVLGAEFVRDVEPGEIVTIDSEGIRSRDFSQYKRCEMCSMEYIYFARPDSDIEGCNVHAYRKESGGQLFGAGGSSLGPGCTPGRRGAAGAGLPGSSLCLCGTGSAAFGAGRGALGRRGGCAGTFQHAGHELLVQGGRQVLGAAVGGQGGIGVVPAGAGVGGVAAAAYGGQHPLSPHAAGQAAVHRHTVVGVQRNGGQLHPIAAAQIQRQGAPRPRCGQDELQPVHPLGVLCAKVQPVRPGHKFGAAALLLKDFDLHAKPPFLFAVPIVPPGAQNYPVCTKNVKFSVLRHFAKRGFGTGNASFFPLPGPGNSSAGFPCKTRDVGQLVLGAAAAAAALFAEKRAGANVKNS